MRNTFRIFPSCTMKTKGNPGDNRTRRSFSIFILFGLCCFFYLLGAWQRSGSGKGDSIAHEITRKADCSVITNLNIETHHGVAVKNPEDLTSESRVYPPCDDQFIDYTPCHDQTRALNFPRENMNYRERHCPSDDEKLHCLIPAPQGYVTPFPWPKSRDYVPFHNVPYKNLTVENAVQNWIENDGNVFRFPGGGKQFSQGADAYIDQIASVIPIGNGMVRTALDTGCGIGSLGAYLFKKNVITMSFAPRDSHEAQVQFALERGVPAFIGVLGTMKLPFPSRSFDIAHCSRCLIPWSQNDGKYMMEVDRVLRPGGYWVLSGPPIDWKNRYEAWKRPKQELEEEQRKIEEIAKLLCWEKKHEKGEMVIWRKRINQDHCQERESRISMCEPTSVDNIWYKQMEACVTPYPNTSNKDKVVGGELKPFPQRLYEVPPRISSGSLQGISAESFEEDTNLWIKHLNAYKRVNKIIGSGRYRNIMDMNAGLGSFAAALESPKSWVMNVMPTIANKDTLGVIYERGLIGIYHDWCEAFSTYPRTYDLIHANGLFSLYKDKCSYEDILLEMDRILRPEGTVIIRDLEIEVLKVKKIVSGMRWNTKMVDHEDGPLVPEKILFVNEANSNSTDLRVASFSCYLKPHKNKVNCRRFFHGFNHCLTKKAVHVNEFEINGMKGDQFAFPVLNPTKQKQFEEAPMYTTSTRQTTVENKSGVVKKAQKSGVVDSRSSSCRSCRFYNLVLRHGWHHRLSPDPMIKKCCCKRRNRI
ncbi:S-adenosyl-L-methionine-dependent methyltransferase [Artemisia annua]|uniref:S-adenosyl-L-methionine-dependent methyltransferase n=1 Tax=Artemisia annua TaxID=35608 RepID=A0A2U1PLX3_ARTAN|nr:S-adenosyl-L-methionine-dependent methyltransferase [Artemisia annua]